ncbi:hypothetical protein [Paenibacillus chitinolyticus]|uniref:hypothetical protein n=1 Tax=Paenibacillus chitinolyticus TaxID=79263 RepID=UPI003659C284
MSRSFFENGNTLVPRGFAFGLVPGAILALFFKAVEYFAGSRVYTLLLNVDFIPGLGGDQPEWFELTLHLAVSVIIGFLYAILLGRTEKPWLPGILLGISPIPLFVPLTQLAVSAKTPVLSDVTAMIWWIAGHLLYGVILAVLGARALQAPKKE